MEEKGEEKTISDSHVSFLQKKKKWFDSLPKFKKVLVVLAGVGILFVLYIISVLVRYDNYSTSSRPIDRDLAENRFESFPIQESGLVCFGDNRFSFKIDSSYKILSDEGKGIAIFTNGRLVTVSINGKNIIETLKDLGINFTKDNDTYFYKVFSDKSYGVSQEKNGSVVSIFSSKANDEDSLRILSGLILSLKEGCDENE